MNIALDIVGDLLSTFHPPAHTEQSLTHMHYSLSNPNPHHLDSPRPARPEIHSLMLTLPHSLHHQFLDHPRRGPGAQRRR